MACRIPPHILAVLAFVSIISLYSLSLVFKAQRYDVSDEGSAFVDEKIPVAQAPGQPVYSSTVEPTGDTPLPAAIPSAPTSTSRSLPVSHPKFPDVVACPSHGTLEAPIEGSDKKALQAAVLERMGLSDAKPLKPGQEGVCFFNSQHAHKQDQKIFKRLGGKIMGCESYKGMKNVHHGSVTNKCACVAPPAAGFNRGFLEIGAADGQLLSNSLFFENQLGWRGVCVEGSPRTFIDLQKNRPLCYNVNALVGARESLGESKTFYSFDYSDPEKRGWHIAMSCMEGNGVCSTAMAAYRYASKSGLCLRVDEVQIKPLSEIFDEAGISGRLGWFSFDVEGAEDFVVPTVDFSKTQPQFVSIEGSRSLHPKAAEHVLSHGYTADGNLGLDELYVLRSF